MFQGIPSEVCNGYNIGIIHDSFTMKTMTPEQYFEVILSCINHGCKVAEVHELVADIEPAFMEKKTKQLLVDRDFSTLAKLASYELFGNYNHTCKTISDYCFEQLNAYVQQREFMELVHHLFRHGNQTNIEFKKFTKEENRQLLSKMWKFSTELLTDEDEAYDHFYRVLNFLALGQRDFIKEFFIQTMPGKIFFESSLSYKADKAHAFITSAYTESELLALMDKLPAQWHASSHMVSQMSLFFDQNFFGSSYIDDRKRLNDLQRYVNFANVVKQKHPLVYIVMCDRSSYDKNLFAYGNTNDYDKVNHHHFFREHFDHHAIFNTLKEMAGKEFKNFFNYGLYVLLANHCYTLYDNNGMFRSDKSCSSKKDSQELFEFVFNHAPYFMVSMPRIGKILHAQRHIQKHIDSFNSPQQVQALLFPPHDPANEELNMLHDSKEEERLNSIIEVFLADATAKGNKVVLDMLSQALAGGQPVDLGYEVAENMKEYLRGNLFLKEKLACSQHYLLQEALAQDTRAGKKHKI